MFTSPQKELAQPLGEEVRFMDLRHDATIWDGVERRK